MRLSEFELEVMQCIWSKGESTAPELHKMIIEKKQVTYSTVKTIIDRLEDKEAIKRIKSYGRTIVYSSLISEDEIRKPMLSRFIKNVFSGNSKTLLNHIVEESELSKSDIEYLELLLKQRKENND